MENRDYDAPNQENDYGNPYNNTQYNNTQYNNTEYYNNQYGNAQYSNLGGTPVDAAGNPLKSYFALQLVFAIIEILCCCLSPVAMILGIIALVFAVQANTSYNQGRGEEFKAKSKTSNILLIIGGVFAAISLLLNVAIFALVPQILEETYNYIEENEDEFLEDGFDFGEDGDYYEEYVGTNEEPLVEGFEIFTLNGIQYSVPMSYDEFVQMGYGIEGLDGNYIFEGETFEYYNIVDGNGAYVGRIRISNDTQEELAPEECTIDYIELYNDAAYDSDIANIDIIFGNGFDMNTSYEELKAWLGEPYYVYEENSDGSFYANYSWEYAGEDKYQYVDVYYLDGVISSITFEQFDYVY